MKTFKTILIIPIVIFGAGFLAPAVQAQPADVLSVEFEGGSPLFNKTNFTPGESITKWIKVTNTSGLTQRIAIEAINFTKPVPETDLSRALMIVIKQGVTEIYGGAGNEKTLYQFYQNGETYLSSVNNGDTAQYDITISFPAEQGDYWQERTTGFDVVVGFEGTEGGLPLPPPGGSASVGGGGGSNGPPGGLPPGLTIQNEANVQTTVDSVTIAWDTSYPATSQVIYALEGESHTLILTDNTGAPPKYGYERTTLESDAPANLNGVLSHSITILGLTPGTKYYYRAVSHGSLAISTEHSFTTLTPEEAVAQATQMAVAMAPAGVGEAEIIITAPPAGGTTSGTTSPAGAAPDLLNVKGSIKEGIVAATGMVLKDISQSFLKSILVILALIILIFLITKEISRKRKKI